MTDLGTLCLGCMADKGEAQVCPHCGYDPAGERSPQALAPGILLNDRFLVGRVLGRPGGFGITYLAYDLTLAATAAIKEFFPSSLAVRQGDGQSVAALGRTDRELFSTGLDEFLAEARTLVQFNHPNIARVRDFFSANGTAYMVMDYCAGTPLDEFLAAQGGRLRWERALEVMLPILDGLAEVHARGYLHRDIKPTNILITRGGRPMLIDFGAARYALGDKTTTLSVILSPGYAPYEQYHRRGRQGPWTDVYACGATLYYLVTGHNPPDAIERQAVDDMQPPASLNARVPPGASAAVMQALAMEPASRPQGARELAAMLTGQAVAPAASTRVTPPAPRNTAPAAGAAAAVSTEIRHSAPAPTPARRWLPGLALAAVLLLAVGGYAWWQQAVAPLPPATPAAPVAATVPPAPSAATVPVPVPTAAAVPAPPAVPAPASATSAPITPPAAPAAPVMTTEPAAPARSGDDEPTTAATPPPATAPPAPAPAAARATPPRAAPPAKLTGSTPAKPARAPATASPTASPPAPATPAAVTAPPQEPSAPSTTVPASSMPAAATPAQPPTLRGPRPPEEAIAACNGLAQGQDCGVPTPWGGQLQGMCVPAPGADLACIPLDHLRAGGPPQGERRPGGQGGPGPGGIGNR